VEHCRAILVRKSRWSESSLIITWLTDRFGTLRTSARGALRPGSTLAGKLDLFHCAEITIAMSRTSSLHSLREVTVESSFRACGSPYASLALASYFAELSAAVAPPMQASHELHDLLGRALDHIAAKPPSRRAFDHFEAETARLLGVFDPSGATPPHVALAQLCGNLPRSRTGALKALEL